jgi:hypothetical protein
MPKRETNVEFVTRVMEFAKSGPMMQAFVIEAMAKYSGAIVEAGRESLREKMGGSFIHPDAWFDCAEELSNEIKNRNS